MTTTQAPPRAGGLPRPPRAREAPAGLALAGHLAQADRARAGRPAPEEPLLRSILKNDRSLMRAVERMRTLPPAATHFERVRIGEAIAGAVAARRDADAQAMIGELRPHAVAVRISDPHHERTALNASFLVDRASIERFDAAVEHLSERHAGEARFKLIGPTPGDS